MKSICTLLFLFVSLFVSAQSELVKDIYEGSESSGIYCNFTFTWNQDCAVQLGDKIIFLAENFEAGRELYVIENGEISLLRDLNNDPSTSNPRFMTVYKDLMYFIADDGSGFKIWQTDGSDLGTNIAFDFGIDGSGSGDYTGFLISNELLFFEFEGTIYSFDGQDLNEVEYDGGLYVIGSSEYGSRAWCPYKEGIAMMDYNGDSWDLLYIHDGLVDSLTNIDVDASFKNPYGLAAFEGGLSFSFDASFDPEIQGRYLYLDGGNPFKQSDDFTRRVISVNNESVLLYGDKEFILYNEDNQIGNQVLTGTLTLAQGVDWNRVVTGEYLAFQSLGGVFDDDVVSILNTQDGSIKTIYEGDDLTRLYPFGDYLFFFAEDQNAIFNEALYQYQISEDELIQVEDFTNSNANRYYPLGIQDGWLFHFANLDENIGTEIYRTKVDLGTSTDDLKPELNHDYSWLRKNSNTLQLVSPLNESYQMDIFTLDGILISQMEISDGDHVTIPYTGMISLRMKNKNFIHTTLKFVSEN